MKILLMCGAGASSGFMAQAMRKAAKEQGLDDIDVIARSEAEMTNNLKGTDIIMFGPHLAYKKDALAKDLEQYNIPFAFIDKDAYGAIDGAATLKQAMDVLKGAKPQEVEKEPVKEVEKKEVKAEVKEEKKETTDLSKMTVAELKKLASERKIAGASTMKKAELLEALK